MAETHGSWVMTALPAAHLFHTFQEAIKWMKFSWKLVSTNGYSIYSSREDKLRRQMKLSYLLSRVEKNRNLFYFHDSFLKKISKYFLKNKHFFQPCPCPLSGCPCFPWAWRRLKRRLSNNHPFHSREIGTAVKFLAISKLMETSLSTVSRWRTIWPHCPKKGGTNW